MSIKIITKLYFTKKTGYINRIAILLPVNVHIYLQWVWLS